MTTDKFICTHPDHNDSETCEDRAIGCSKHCVCCMGRYAVPVDDTHTCKVCGVYLHPDYDICSFCYDDQMDNSPAVDDVEMSCTGGRGYRRDSL